MPPRRIVPPELPEPARSSPDRVAPALTALARRALGSRQTLLVRSSPPRGHQVVPVPAPPLGRVPLHGLHCSRGVTAVGYPAVLDGSPGGPVLGVGVATDGSSVLLDDRGRNLCAATAFADLLTDPGRRALGLATPPPPASIGVYVVSAWLDGVLDELLDADLGAAPCWEVLTARHPLATPGSVGPRELRRRTDALSGGWEALRRRVATSGLEGSVVSSGLAAWFDEGAFARRLLSSTGDGTELLPDVLDLLGRATAERVLIAIGDHLAP